MAGGAGAVPGVGGAAGGLSEGVSEGMAIAVSPVALLASVWLARQARAHTARLSRIGTCA